MYCTLHCVQITAQYTTISCTVQCKQWHHVLMHTAQNRSTTTIHPLLKAATAQYRASPSVYGIQLLFCRAACPHMYIMYRANARRLRYHRGVWEKRYQMLGWLGLSSTLEPSARSLHGNIERWIWMLLLRPVLSLWIVVSICVCSCFTS